MSEHEMTVVRLRPQFFVLRCTCGFEGRNRKGTPFWNAAGGFNAAIKHAADAGIPFKPPAQFDEDPASRRARR